MNQNNVRTVQRVITAHRQREGGGFIVRRPFPTAGFDLADPFLLLDELGPVDYAPGEAVGAPDHPHRGFETVTYVLEGEGEHEDSAGHRGVIGPGDVQWMTAGRGVIHSEMPSRTLRTNGGRMHGFQLWVNLPARDKMMDPRYQEIPSARIPEARTPDGLAHVRVIAGEALGVRAVIDTRTPIAYHDWTLEPGANVEVALPATFAAYTYVFGGTVQVGGRSVKDGQLAVLGRGESRVVPAGFARRHSPRGAEGPSEGPLHSRVRLAVPASAEGPARLLLLAGAPLREPVVAYGPFVMNTEEQIMTAIRDYQTGRMGAIAR
jgi:redox-sensitive bicupin YhaK (pirin superfamily)